jgi:hypothetical protein
MPSYLVEVYLPRSRAREARAIGLRARAAAEQLSREGVPIRYVRTTYLPDDATANEQREVRVLNEKVPPSNRCTVVVARIPVTAVKTIVGGWPLTEDHGPRPKRHQTSRSTKPPPAMPIDCRPSHRGEYAGKFRPPWTNTQLKPSSGGGLENRRHQGPYSHLYSRGGRHRPSNSTGRRRTMQVSGIDQ